MLRIAMIIILMAQSAIHFMGAAQSWASFDANWAVQNPWVFSAGVTLRSTAGKAMSLLWIAALVVLALGTFGFSTGKEWTRAVLAAGAALSILAVVPWTNAIPESQHFAILSIDVLILIVCLFRWQIKLPM